MSINEDLRSQDGIPIDQLIGLLLQFPSDRRVRINREMLIIRDPTTRSTDWLDEMNARDPIITAQAARDHLHRINQIPEYKIFSREDLAKEDQCNASPSKTNKEQSSPPSTPTTQSSKKTTASE